LKDLSQRSSPLQSRPSEPPGHSGSWFLLTLCALLAITAGCKADNTLQHIQHKQVLTVATLNGPATYYENKLGPTGFEYALAREFADNLGVELDIRTAYTPGQLFRMLDRNRADIAAAGLAATSERVEHYRFSFPYFESTPLVVYREGTLRPRKIEDILERDIMVLENSQHAHLLRQLAARHPRLRWRETSQLDTLDLMDRVETGELLYTVVDSRDFAINKAYYPLVRRAFALSEPMPMGWAMSKRVADDDLYAAVNLFMARIGADGTLATLVERYYGHTTHAGQGDARTFTRNVERRLPNYETLIKQVAREEGLDWRLLAVISYRESHWNPSATSPTGVRGMMMLTRTTAKEMGVHNRLDAEQSLRGGARYFLKIRRRIPQRIRDPDRTWFALAAYNAGLGHVHDARILTQQQGGSPDKWSDVMQRLPLLQQREYYKQTKYGYARGTEAVTYVQHIRNYYNLLEWQQAERSRRKPPTRVEALLPLELRNTDALKAI
jgi:membrane-bound lytic murein transglycosylase F